MRRMLLPGLLLLTGVLPHAVGFSLCGWRNQSNNGNLLRWRGFSGDNLRVENSAEALTVSAPFQSSNSVTLPALRGMYSFCIHWIPGLQIFNITYGVTRYYEIPRNQSLMSNDSSHTSCDSAHTSCDSTHTSCDSAFSLINVTINGERKSNSCHYEHPIEGRSYDAKSLQEEMLQVGEYLQRKEFHGDRRLLRDWIEASLSRVHIDGKSQIFGAGLLRAAVYQLDSPDVLKSIPETLGVSLTFPERLLQKEPDGTTKRLHVVRVQGAAIFQKDANISILGDQVLGVTLQDTPVYDLPEDIVITFPHEPIQDSGSPLCVFWDESMEDWSSAGCRTVMGERHTQCRCDHLTYFAVLMQTSSQVISEIHLVSLTIITFAGCAISAVSCVFTIVWICCSRQNQRNPTLQIHVHLLVALLLLDVAFIVSAVLGGLEDVVICRGSAIALHFSLLCLFTWMAIEGFNLYRLVLVVFQSPLITTGRLAILGWGLPILMVAAVLLMDSSYYGISYINVDRPSSHNRRATMCWLTEPMVHQVVNLGYFGAVLLFNVCMLVAMTTRVLRLSAHSRQEEVRRCVTLLGLSCMLGVPWGLAFCAFGVFYLPIQYAFSILNALQGLFIFLWYCVLSQPPAKQSPPTTHSTSATPTAPTTDQSVSSDHNKLLLP